MLPELPQIDDLSVEVSFERSVNRLQVNRLAIAEVFLTDFHPIDETTLVCGAQLPLYHAYYSDHLSRPETYDLLLLLECCRQASTYGGRVHYGQPADSTNLIHDMEIRIVASEALRIRVRPGELTMRVTAHDTVAVGKSTRGVTLVQMYLAGRYIGHARFGVTVVSNRTYRALRMRQRSTPPPLSTDLPEVPDGEPVVPCRVGRQNPANVVLTEAETLDSGAVVAKLGVQPRNRSILDHEYDHFPAMSLLEAARQAGLLAMEAMPAPVGGVRAVLLRGTFNRFAELDSAVVVRARPSGAMTFDVELTQNGQSIATVTAGYASGPFG